MRKSLAAACLLLVSLGLTACGGQPDATQKVTGINAMAVLGDSISQASTTCQALTNCPENSWATGTNTAVNSHLQRLEAEEGHPVTAYNDSVVGARAVDLAAQAQAAVPQQPGYIAILMGANDYCSPSVDTMTDPTIYQQQVSQALSILNSSLPATKIYLASLPDATSLYTSNRDNAAAQQVWASGICQSLLASPADTSQAAQDRRSTVQTRAEAYDAALKTACAAAINCHYDDGTVTAQKYTATEIGTLDFFHPSIAGQTKLADITWNQGGVHAFLVGTVK